MQNLSFLLCVASLGTEIHNGIWYQVLQLLHSIMSTPLTSGILQIQWTCIVSPTFHSASITLILLQWEWCHLPLLQRLQLMLPHLVLIEQAVSMLFSICKHCGKGNCEKATVGSWGDRRQQGGGPGILQGLYCYLSPHFIPWTKGLFHLINIHSLQKTFKYVWGSVRDRLIT